MTVLDDFQALQRKVEKARKAAAEAAGALKQSRSTLKAEYGVSNLAEAKARLVELETEEKVIAEEYLDKKAEFEEKYADILKGMQ